jgi:hypothetical protein
MLRAYRVVSLTSIKNNFPTHYRTNCPSTQGFGLPRTIKPSFGLKGFTIHGFGGVQIKNGYVGWAANLEIWGLPI